MKNILSQLSQMLSGHTRIIPILGVLALVLALPLTLSLLEQNQDNRQQAAGTEEQLFSQADPSASSSATTCASVGGECVADSEWVNSQALFAAASVDGTYSCPRTGDVCVVQKRPTIENQTCTGSCDISSSMCEANGGIVTSDTCHNKNLCCMVPSQPEPTTYPPLGSACSDGSGNFSCGFGTSDTGCPVCSPVADCSTGNYSILNCSGTAVCTQDSDCANNPPSCPAGQTGTVVCNIPSGQTQGSCQTVNCK